MSAGIFLDTADAVVAALIAGTVPGSDPAVYFKDLVDTPIRRELDPELELEDAEKSHLFIVPGSPKSEIGTREAKRSEFPVDIALRKKLVPENLKGVDAMFKLLGDIDDYLFSLQGLPALPGPMWLTSTMRYPYVMPRWRANKEYLGILTVTYLIFE
jgi:hypothetical protein